MIEHRPAPEPSDAASAQPGDRVHVKLTDFGIAKLLDAQGVTSTGQVLGSPAHMAPEQIEGGDVDGRADVFGLGVLLYESVVGHLPFEGKNPAQVLRRVLEGTYPSAERERPKVGKRWSAILDRALARLPGDRYGDALAMQGALVSELKLLGIDTPRAELEAWFDDPAGYAAAPGGGADREDLRARARRAQSRKRARGGGALQPRAGLRAARPRAPQDRRDDASRARLARSRAPAPPARPRVGGSRHERVLRDARAQAAPRHPSPRRSPCSPAVARSRRRPPRRVRPTARPIVRRPPLLARDRSPRRSLPVRPRPSSARSRSPRPTPRSASCSRSTACRRGRRARGSR